MMIDFVLSFLFAAMMAYFIEDWWKHRNDDR
jgi:hypothetical protein